MKKYTTILVTCLMMFSSIALAQERVELPEPKHEGEVSVEEAIFNRKSIRSFTDDSLTVQDVSQLLWAAGGQTVDGITGPTRAYPSAGAIYPLDLYIVIGNVVGIPPGAYKYDWSKHALDLITAGDVRQQLSEAGFGQRMIMEAPVTMIVVGLFDKVANRYGEENALRFVYMDTGHMGQNVHLEAESLGLGTVMVGALYPDEVAKVIKSKEGKPVYMMPVGYSSV